MPTLGAISDADLDCIISVAGAQRRFDYLFNSIELKKYFDWDKTLFILDTNGTEIDWAELLADLTSWANALCVPRAVKLNQQRVLMAIPEPPQADPAKIFGSTWVVECEDRSTQGTAFDLDGFGTITNEHVVNGASKISAFRAAEPSLKYKVSILKSHPVIDVAFLKIHDLQPNTALSAQFDQPLDLMQHVFVCGYPNYRTGDSGILTPGLVVGTRPVSGITRLLTNAPIVRGMSGGPAIGTNNRVIGICTSGSKSIEDSKSTEDQSIVPIDAIRLF